MGRSEQGACRSFSTWEIDLARRELRANGVVIPIGNRAFDIVEILVRSSGELVTKDDLVRRAWPGVAVVEEATVRVHISAIRKALGPDRDMLQTAPGRGYRLLGEWTMREDGARAEPDLPALATAAPSAFRTNVPVVGSALIGRETPAQNLCDLVIASREVTLTGPGGIGKTVLASEVARRLFPTIESDVFFVELVSLSDPQLVPTTVASVLGLRVGGNEISPASVARAIGNRKVLLVLDNCEHIIDAVAELADTLLRQCPHTTVLATSREALRIEGEFVYHVAPLEVPSKPQETSREILKYSAVQLFVTRMGAEQADLLTHDANLIAIASIVRRLDGIPLAIEFAAARAGTFGIQEVADRLDNRFALLTGGRRTALPRHQTLRATLDWSYELLPEHEQRLLRYAAVFAGGFTPDAAVAVMAAPDDNKSATMNGVTNLIDKSLIVTDDIETVRRWRLLETTRAYAIEKLFESGEAAHVARRHAKFYQMQFAQFASEGQLQAHIDDPRSYRREIDNLRAALNWAFSSVGDVALGVELAASAADFWFTMPLLAEASDWAEKALAQIGDAVGTHHEMVLQSGLGLALIYTRGMISPARAALTRALQLAQELGDSDYQQRATHGLWLFLARSAASKEALNFARGYEEMAGRRDDQSQAVADWIVGIPLTYMAAHGEARDRLQRAIEHYPAERRKLDLVRFGADVRASASAHLTVNLLSLGYPDAASRTALFSIEEARAIDNPNALCISLAWAAGFVCISLDELDRAEQFGNELIDCGYKHSLRPFYAAGQCVRGSLLAKRGDPRGGIDLLRSGLVEMKSAAYLLFYPFYVAELAAALGVIGRVDEGLAELDAALHLAAEIDYRWFVPELLRVKGQLLLRGGDAAAEAEKLFRRSIQMAHEQQALYWELCTAASLAELMRGQQRYAEAHTVLGPVYDRMTEGFAASRVSRIKLLLDQ